MKGPVKSRKGIATAIGAVFFILIVIVGFVTIWTINTYEARYQEVKTRMNEWDVQRISENLLIRNVENSAPPGYNLTITVDNNGGVPLNIARIYVYDQTNKSNLYVYNNQNGSSVGFANGTINTGEVNHKILVRGVPLNISHQYRIILTTDRGRQFSYSYPPPSMVVGGGYALIISDDQDNFQYAAGTMTYFVQAYVKPKGTDNTLYRILINNTTAKTIIFHQNCSMLQIQGAVGAITLRYVVSNLTQPPTNNKNPVPFVSQTLNPYSSQYLYFGSTTPGGNQWQDEPTKKDYYLVGFILYFRYQGESEIRNISLPPITQELK